MLSRASLWVGRDDAQKAILLYIAAGFVFSALDAYVKAVVSTVPVVGTLWARGIVFLVLLLVLSGRGRPQELLRSRSPLRQAARAVTLFIATLTFFFSLSILPLGQAVALASVSPLMVVALAGPVLHEHVSRAAVIGAVIGFVGVVLLVGLDPGSLGFWALLPLASSASFAVFSLLSRSVGHEPEAVTLFYTGAIGLALATVTLVVLWPSGTEVDPAGWIAAGSVGILSLTAHRLLTMAYRRGEASDIAPFGYLSLVWAFLIGAVLFGEPIELGAIIGATTIAIGGLIAIRGVAADAPEAAMVATPGMDVAVDDDPLEEDSFDRDP